MNEWMNKNEYKNKNFHTKTCMFTAPVAYSACVT